MSRWMAAIGPGLLVAATGVGAGDLATASFTGNQLGVSVLWAVVLGAFFKYVLNEGLARFQLATGETLLEGAVRRLGRPVRILFVVYFFPWSFFVGSALISACGVAAHALIPLFDSSSDAKIFWGLLHSAAGVGLVLLGGYSLFDKVMRWCIGVMFLTVMVTAVAMAPDGLAVLKGIAVPVIPDVGGEGLSWTVALIGGVGGTLTVLCYGYWIREIGRTSEGDLLDCRVDLAVGYVATALFGMAMVIIGSQAPIQGKGAGLIVALAEAVVPATGVVGKWMFLFGAWAAIFSSLLGVWQAVPYLFADFANLWYGVEAEVDVKSGTYIGFLIGLATIPSAGLFFSFKTMQMLYAVVGASFLPLLALCLLYLNAPERIGERIGNGRWSVAGLAITMLFFLAAGGFKLGRILGF